MLGGFDRFAAASFGEDCQFVSGMQPPGAGRNTIDPRVVSLYVLFSGFGIAKTGHFEAKLQIVPTCSNIVA